MIWVTNQFDTNVNYGFQLSSHDATSKHFQILKAGYKCAFDFYVPANANCHTLEKHFKFMMTHLMAELDEQKHFKRTFYAFFYIRKDNDLDQKLLKLVKEDFGLEVEHHETNYVRELLMK